MKYLKRFFRLVRKELTFNQKVERGLVPQFHGNNKVRDITIGKYSYVSFNSIVFYTDIGNYCSIGPNVVIGYGDHPLYKISTSPHVYLNDKLWNNEKIEEVLESHFKKVIIKNDVWIGANVYIKNGVTIGNGAVIGAGAVVLKDVGDYEIVVGVPAKSIKKRFSDDIIKLLLETQWWLFNIEDLSKHCYTLENPTVHSLVEIIKELKHEQ